MKGQNVGRGKQQIAMVSMALNTKKQRNNSCVMIMV